MWSGVEGVTPARRSGSTAKFVHRCFLEAKVVHIHALYCHPAYALTLTDAWKVPLRFSCRELYASDVESIGDCHLGTSPGHLAINSNLARTRHVSATS